jgi:hypothetical protein
MGHSQNQDQNEKLSKLYEKCLDGDHTICNKCDGTGIDPSNMIFKTICDKCWGDGILDWIDNIMGKDCPFESGYSACSSFPESDYSTSSSSSSPSQIPTAKAVKDYLEFANKRRN